MFRILYVLKVFDLKKKILKKIFFKYLKFGFIWQINKIIYSFMNFVEFLYLISKL